jgi:hypothetical protein
MAYSKKNAICEVTLINIIRITYVAICVCFVLPMFKGEVTWLGTTMLTTTHTLTGFDTIFGVDDTLISGHPLALVVFIFPLIAIMATLLDFLYDYLHIIVLVASIAGFLLTLVYFIAVMVLLHDELTYFGISIYHIRANLSWGFFVHTGLYVATMCLSFLYKKTAKG